MKVGNDGLECVCVGSAVGLVTVVIRLTLLLFCFKLFLEFTGLWKVHSPCFVSFTPVVRVVIELFHL
jgi:hypothetical protein